MIFLKLTKRRWQYLSLPFFFILLFATTQSEAELSGEVSVDFKGTRQTVMYDLYLPKGYKQTRALPIMICSGGVPLIDGEYEHSSPKDCHGAEWKKFANKNNVAILGLGFLVVENDWQQRQSYQFPQAWSAEALENILAKLVLEYPLNSNRLYMFGISGGAQFSVRFAFYKPDSVKAVAAHAAGSYDPPLHKIDTHFLITVGDLDEKDIVRKSMAQEFTDTLSLFDIDNELLIIPDIAHEQTEKQNQMSRDFFVTIENGLKNKEELISKKTRDIKTSLPMGLTQEEVFAIFPQETVRTRRYDKDESFLTFFYTKDKKDFLTLHFKAGILFNWGLNARHEIVQEYLSEFLSGGIIRGYPKTFQAIQNVLNKLPQEAFIKVIDRDRPVIFLDVTTTGIARYANATDFYFEDNDPPALSRGFYLIKLGHDLENSEDVESIEGVIFHELTHHVLDHLRGPVDCNTEREANRLVKEWGFEKEFKKASSQFGAKSSNDSPCYEEK